MIDPTGPRIAAVEREMELRAPTDRVWKAITDAQELSGWFSNAASLDLKPGGDATFTWSGGHPDSGTYLARIERVEPPHVFAYRWARDADTPVDEGPSTLVEFTLDPTEGGGTRLRLRESGFEREQDRRGNDAGWVQELGELRRHVEEAA
jgi:uncharacterized protein YndB with AHSA1/START domain